MLNIWRGAANERASGATYNLGQNQHSNPVVLSHDTDVGWRIRDLKTGQGVYLSPDQIALIHQVVKPK
jgi:hypothetical protein